MNYEYCDGVTHTIKKGDTLYEISRKYNVALSLLLRANPYVDVFNLQIGDTICIPTSPEQAVPYPVSGSPVSEREGGCRDCRIEAEQLEEKGRKEAGSKEMDDDNSCGTWQKYVVQPGDTMADVLKDMMGDAEDFLERNPPSTIYMLPGVAYYIRKCKGRN